MLIELQNLASTRISARDGMLGVIGDLFVDLNDWSIRYLIAEAVDQVGECVVISPSSVEVIEIASDRVVFTVPKFRRSQLLKGAALEQSTLDRFPRDDEFEMATRFCWPVYWLGRARDESVPTISENWDMYSVPGNVMRLSSMRNFSIAAADSTWKLRDFLVDLHAWVVGAGLVSSSRTARSVTRFGLESIRHIDFATREIHTEAATIRQA